MRRALAGLWVIMALPVLLVAMTVLTPPTRVPTHWSGDLPDGFTDGPGFTAVVLSTTVLCVIAAAGTSVLQRVVPALWGRWLLTAVAAVAWGAVLLYALTLWRVQVVGAEQVRQWWALLALAGALAAAVVAYRVHGTRRPTQAELDEQVPERARVRPVRGRGVRPVQPWTTQVASTTLRVIGWGLVVVFAVVLVLLVVRSETWSLILVVLLAGVLPGVLALAWSRITVSVDADGLRVRSAVLPLPLSRVPAGQVAGVHVQELDPMAWGGIGLRALPDRTAYIVGPGLSGIVVHKRDGRRFALQVTEGDEAARTGARTLLQAAGQRLGEGPSA